MRYLRLSFFPDMTHPPMTTIVAEDSLNVDIERAYQMQMRDAIKAGGFVTGGSVELDTDDLQEATIRITQSIDQQREHNMAVLFFWNVMHMDRVRDGGMILPNPAAPNYPAPLTGDEARSTMEKIALSPKTKPSVTVETHCEDGTKLRLLNGKVTNV